MDDELFFHAIQYLDSLYEEGVITAEKAGRLAIFSMELGNRDGAWQTRKRTARGGAMPYEDETNAIISDILSEDWRPARRT